MYSFCSFEPGVLLWPFIDYLCFSYCSFEPGVLLWPFIKYLCLPCCSLEPGVLVWPFIDNLCIFHIARLSQAFSCGHLLNICVFPIARLSQAFSCGHLLIISVFHIPYSCIPYCSFEPGVLLWPFTEYFGERLPAETPGTFYLDFTLVGKELTRVKSGKMVRTMSSVLYFICNIFLDEIELLTFKGDIGRGMFYANRDHIVS